MLVMGEFKRHLKDRTLFPLAVHGRFTAKFYLFFRAFFKGYCQMTPSGTMFLHRLGSNWWLQGLTIKNLEIKNTPSEKSLKNALLFFIKCLKSCTLSTGVSKAKIIVKHLAFYSVNIFLFYIGTHSFKTDYERLRNYCSGKSSGGKYQF
jgi:hypothetical protein